MVKKDLRRILSDTRDTSIDNPIPIARRKLSEIDIDQMNIDKEVIQGIIDSVSESIDRRPGNATVYLETDPPKALLEGLKKYLKLDFDGIIVPKQYKMDEGEDIDWNSIYKIPKSFQYGAWYVSPPNWHDLQLKRQSSEKTKITLPSSIRRRADVRKRISQLLIRSLVEHSNSESRHCGSTNRNSMNGNKIRSSAFSSSASKNQTAQQKRAQNQIQESAFANLPSIGTPSNDFRNTVLGHQPSEIDPLQVNIAEMVRKITGLDTSSWPNEHIVQPASKQTNHLYNFTSPTSVMNSSAGINSPDRNGGFLTINNSSLSSKGLESLPDPGLSADVEDRLLKRYSHHLQQTEANASLSSNINLFGKSAIGLNKLMSSSMIGNWDSEGNASAGKLASNMNLLSVRADSARKRVLVNDGVNAREFRGNES
ncbi:hypothetical protein BKA69DRAFT_1078368 [Paraphysoderma sedebokerense]|nr:hypothetical protein BKA69DRAFT_1078368 [Paraphysoderma sedebokerense]